MAGSCDTGSAPSDYIGPTDPAESRELNRRASESSPGPLPLTVREAVLLGLENNRALQLERLGPAIAQTYEVQQAAVF
jgi:hypothetical protein